MKLTTINSIETSSICDNKCEYCPAKDQHRHRDVGFMDMETFKQALSFVTYCVRKGTQMELNLFGVGEPTLNPFIVEMVRLAREALPARLPVHMNTNGNTMTKELAIRLKQAGLSQCDITYHHPKPAANTHRIFEEVGIPHALSTDAVLNPNTWAGQVDWFHPVYHKRPGNNCPWLNRGQAFIMSNGDISTCCIDAFANGIVGNIFNTKPEDIELKEFDLCAKCHHVTPAKEKSIIVNTSGQQFNLGAIQNG